MHEHELEQEREHGRRHGHEHVRVPVRWAYIDDAATRRKQPRPVVAAHVQWDDMCATPRTLYLVDGRAGGHALRLDLHDLLHAPAVHETSLGVVLAASLVQGDDDGGADGKPPLKVVNACLPRSRQRQQAAAAVQTVKGVVLLVHSDVATRYAAGWAEVQPQARVAAFARLVAVPVALELQRRAVAATEDALTALCRAGVLNASDSDCDLHGPLVSAMAATRAALRCPAVQRARDACILQVAAGSKTPCNVNVHSVLMAASGDDACTDAACACAGAAAKVKSPMDTMTRAAAEALRGVARIVYDMFCACDAPYSGTRAEDFAQAAASSVQLELARVRAERACTWSVPPVQVERGDSGSDGGGDGAAAEDFFAEFGGDVLSATPSASVLLALATNTARCGHAQLVVANAEERLPAQEALARHWADAALCAEVAALRKDSVLSRVLCVALDVPAAWLCDVVKALHDAACAGKRASAEADARCMDLCAQNHLLVDEAAVRRTKAVFEECAAALRRVCNVVDALVARLTTWAQAAGECLPPAAAAAETEKGNGDGMSGALEVFQTTADGADMSGRAPA